MHQSLIINFLTRNVNKLQPLDYAILAVLGVALLVAVIVVFRLVLRAFSGRKRSSTGISATADEAVFADREVLKLFQVERQALERQVAVLDETFAAFRDIYGRSGPPEPSSRTSATACSTMDFHCAPRSCR